MDAAREHHSDTYVRSLNGTADDFFGPVFLPLIIRAAHRPRGASDRNALRARPWALGSTRTVAPDGDGALTGVDGVVETVLVETVGDGAWALVITVLKR